MAKPTRFDRFRTLLGIFLAVCGVVAITVLGALYGYTKATLWVAGILLIISGVFIAKSDELAKWLNDTLNF